jgi:hypothetical protein
VLRIRIQSDPDPMLDPEFSQPVPDPYLPPDKFV